MAHRVLRLAAAHIRRYVHTERHRWQSLLLEIESPGDRAWDGRYLAATRSLQYRRARLAAAVLFEVAIGTIPMVVLIGSPGRIDVVGLACLEALAALVLWRFVAPMLRHNPTILALLVGSTATCFTMFFGLREPSLHNLVAGFLTIIPLASTILLFWRPRTHIAALAVFYGMTVGYILWAPVGLEQLEQGTILLVTGVACALSVFGNYEGTARRHDRARQARELRIQRVELRQVARERALEARTDVLTGLASRRALNEDLEALQVRLAASGRRASVSILDLDRFKSYNDRYGHPAGDDVLSVIGDVLRGGLRQGDIAYRYGGEEFLLVLEDASVAQAEVIVGRIRDSLDACGLDHEGNGPWLRVTFSAGIAMVDPAEGISVDAALRLADRRLYAAKEQGRNRTVGRPAPVAAGWNR